MNGPCPARSAVAGVVLPLPMKGVRCGLHSPRCLISDIVTRCRIHSNQHAIFSTAPGLSTSVMICPSGPDTRTIPPGSEALRSGVEFQNINQKNTSTHTTKTSCRLAVDVYVSLRKMVIKLTKKNHDYFTWAIGGVVFLSAVTKIRLLLGILNYRQIWIQTLIIVLFASAFFAFLGLLRLKRWGFFFVYIYH